MLRVFKMKIKVKSWTSVAPAVVQVPNSHA